MIEFFDKQHSKCAEALLTSVSQHLLDIHWSLPNQLTWKTSPLLTCQILGLLVHTLSADEKYPVFNRHNLTIPSETPLSQKKKPFLNFLLNIWNLDEILNIFDEKDGRQRFCNFQITDSENVVRKMSKEPRFREPFDKQHGKRADCFLPH